MKKVALVTGAAQGLGFVIAERLLKAGYCVAISDRDYEGAKLAAIKLDASGECTLAIELDVSSKPAFEKGLGAVLGKWGAVHVLVNNAAVTKTTPLMQISPEEFDSVVGLNLRSIFLGCQVVGAYMAETGFGRIFNMASLAGQNGGTATGAHYAASKGAIVTLTKIFAKEFASRGVTVNAIAPGPIDSPMVRAAVPADRMGALCSNIPVGRLGDAAFLGDLIVQFSGEDAYFATGSTLDINGGLFMR
ncbi:3-oxoacyl-[acyl-carrier protein] reductase [Pseudomonas reinekei]|uniref:2,3-dihydroxy-2,3-dihydro-p-cumate dehydrogenase n=1 Tax=Pseudomonas reinekei TaxID=395598 RepID=A0A1H0ITB3_PSERE|nr:SDR family NAD(P)-dependent oxidoreductase [Pseudomonas reinekei]KAB0486643.1 SDR family oxidoreductase [Pseudomonas reinekei]OLU04357.1 3-oxoacyl-ACP reductase [Pseudomonas reinekei]SDO34563.1 3-oxoacyl-[acyl-carrier protein] reductase [Pseudomonas reinekei]